MPAPAPLITPPTADLTPAPQGPRSSFAGALPSRTSSTTTPMLGGPAITLSNTTPTSDPRFQNVMDKLSQSATKAQEHPPATQKVAEAHAAAVPPTNEKVTIAESNKVDTMHAAPTKKPDSDSFLNLLRSDIAKVMPQTLGDTDKFMKGGKREQLKQAATGHVNQQKNAATTGLQSASNARPDTSNIKGKQVTPLPASQVPGVPPAIGAANAVPLPKSEAEVSLQKSTQDADASLGNAHVTPEQLKKANDPRFSAVLTAKAAVDTYADTGPKAYRGNESTMLTQATGQAVGEEKQSLSAFQDQGSQAAINVQGKQVTAKGKDEAARQQVTDHIQRIYDATKKAVDSKLSSLEKEVGDQFDQGVNKALDSMTRTIDNRMSAWKWQRYLSNPLVGPALWLRDQFLGLPDDVQVFYSDGRKQFMRDLDGVIVQIANLVEQRLQEAKDLIASGQQQISTYVNGLPANLQQVGQAAEQEMDSRFNDMRQEVDDEKNKLAESLAQQYKGAVAKADSKLQEMQDANKGLVTTLLSNLATVVQILTAFRDRLLSILKEAQETIELIVADPIGFLKNLLNALKQGLVQFVRNIWKHLQEGFMQWLLGSLATMGITMPPDLSLGSILQLVLQVLGLTYDRIRAKAVKYIGERNVELIEKAWELLSALLKGGPMALWEQIKENLSNLKDMVIGALQNWLVTTVIQTAVIKLAELFAPAGAIIEAITTIYSTVMFFIDRINQIMAFVQAILNSVLNIARGNISAAANWIENALARSIPVIIGFLASLLGISGITEKIRSIIEKVQGKIDSALDKLIEKFVALAKKVLNKIKSLVKAGLKKMGIGKKEDEKEEQGEEWWKEKVQFKAEDGETHTIFFEGEGEHAVLMIASYTTTYVDFVNAISDQGDPHLKVVKDNARTEAKSIDALKDKSDKIGSKDEDTRQHLKDLSYYIIVLAAATKINPPSVIEYGTLTQDGGGKYMHAKILAKNAVGGDAPEVEPKIWRKARRRRGKKMVRGHLLNHNIGGSGRTYNLTPTSKTTNNHHKDWVETNMKKWVNNENKVIEYKVKVNYPNEGTQTETATDTTGKLQEARAYEKDYLAKELVTEWWTLKYDPSGKQWIKDPAGESGSKTIPNEIPSDDDIDVSRPY